MIEKQDHFAGCLAMLIVWARSRGYMVTMGEAWRSPETCALYAAAGKGSRNSLHPLRLATDLCLFDAHGKQLTEKSDYQPLGDYWKSLSTPEYRCAWGGDFPRLVDSNHFSMEHNGFR